MAYDSSTPDVSVIVPLRNQAETLPRLFDSLLAQQGVRLEAVIVDDLSDEPFDDVLDAWRARGLDITLVRPGRRLYTKDARLEGIRAARASLIAFADADDALVGKETLARHVRQMWDENADLLHFRCFIANPDGSLQRYVYVADPFADRLKDQDIFAHYLKTDIHGACVLWNKLYRRDLFMSFVDYAAKSRVRRYVEDLYLTSLYCMHAKRYIGSHEVGYSYFYFPKDRKDAAERAVYTWYMREELLPYMEQLGLSEETRMAYAWYLEHYISLAAGRLCVAIGEEEGADISDATIDDLLTQVDGKTLLKTLLLGNRLNANKIVSATRLLRTGKIY